MFGFYALEKYAKEGGKENAKAALTEMDKGALMAEENFYTLGWLMNMIPSEAYKKLVEDATKEE